MDDDTATGTPDSIEPLIGRMFATPGGGAPLPLARGTIVGRYTILERLGIGGMGVVYAAYDPKLDRRVALKLIRSGNVEGATARERQARLLREGQAMARVSHPNVLTVHDVGSYEDQVFVAMELVVGTTLGAWSRAEQRSWREVQGVFVQAGRGLAAAHREGLIHRDFKPDNVLVGDDGRVRVADFGLARAVAGPGEPDSAPRPDEELTRPEGGSGLSTPLTIHGAVVGTPHFMSPEQLRGVGVGPASDQFSFSVGLYHTLAGAYPFASREDALAGRARPPPRDSSAPAWLWRVVLRGLSAEPTARFPSMDALLAALRPERGRRSRILVAFAVVAVACLALLGYRALESGESPCPSAERRLAGVWDAARRDQVRTAFLSVEKPFARESFERVGRAFDAYGAEWVREHREACLATRVRGEQSEQLLDLRMQCLDGRLRDLGALAELFARADAKTVERATSAVGNLRALSSCADAAALLAGMDPPPNAQRPQIDALQARLSQVRAQLSAGKYLGGVSAAASVTRDSQGVGYAPLVAEALFEEARLLARATKWKEAEAKLHHAAAAAEGAAHREVRAEAWGEIVGLAHRVGRTVAETEWAVQHTEAAIARLRGARVAGVIAAELELNLGLFLSAVGKAAEAMRHHQASLALFEKHAGADSPYAATAHGGLGIAYGRQGDHRRSRDHFARALAILEKSRGPHHPSVAAALSNLGAAAHGLGRYPEALVYSQRAIAILEPLVGPNDTALAELLETLGNAHDALGRYEEAQAAYRRALAIHEATVGKEDPAYAVVLHSLGLQAVVTGQPAKGLEMEEQAGRILRRRFGEKHPFIAQGFDDVGDAQLALGRAAEAIATHERALRMREQIFGKDHVDSAVSEQGMGAGLLAQTRAAAALGHLARARALREKGLDASHPLLGATLTLWGEAKIALGRPAEALPELERARRIAAESPSAPRDRAGAAIALAKALRATGGAAERSCALASEARAAYERAGSGFVRELAAVERFLATCPAR